MSRVDDGTQLDGKHQRAWCDVLFSVILDRHDFDPGKRRRQKRLEFGLAKRSRRTRRRRRTSRRTRRKKFLRDKNHDPDRSQCSEDYEDDDPTGKGCCCCCWSWSW
jgi:hypothetical protein